MVLSETRKEWREAYFSRKTRATHDLLNRSELLAARKIKVESIDLKITIGSEYDNRNKPLHCPKTSFRSTAHASGRNAARAVFYQCFVQVVTDLCDIGNPKFHAGT